MKKHLLAFASLLLVSCNNVPDKNVGAAASQMSGKKLQVLVGKTPSFGLMTGGTAATWGILGPLSSIPAGASANSNGNELVRTNNIKDPAFMIASNLGNKLKSKRNVVLLSPEPTMLETDDEAIIKQMNSDADYLLKIYTTGWGTMYNLPGELAVGYSSHMYLVDNRTGETISESNCFIKDDHEHGLDELRANGAAKIKSILVRKGNECIDKFSPLL